MRLRHLSALAASISLAACSPESEPTPEPNNTIAQATAIAANAAVDATMDGSYDLDYYRFTVPAGGAFVGLETFDASGVGCQGIDPYLELVEADGTPYGWAIASDDDSGPEYCSRIVSWLAEGTYYAVVSHAGFSAPVFPYTLVVSASQPPAGASESELNGTIGTADGPFSGDALVSGAISTSSAYSIAYDNDYFAVANPTGVPQTVYLETFQDAVGSCAVDTTLYLYDAFGAQLAYNDEGGVGSCSAITFTLPPNTTYYARVTNYWSYASFSYLLAIVFL